MTSKGRLLPLLLLSLAAFFSTPTSILLTPSSASDLVLKFNLPIPISLFPQILPSLLKSLPTIASIPSQDASNPFAKADYGQDHVDLHIIIDHFKELYPKNQFEILNKTIGESHKILEFVDQFVWTFGKKFVHYTTVNGGLQVQWLEAWWPSSDDEFAFVVDDDMEVSPLYYRFLRSLISNYYYNAVNSVPLSTELLCSCLGLLQVSTVINCSLDSEIHLFLYQMVGTWGLLLFPKPWRELPVV